MSCPFAFLPHPKWDLLFSSLELSASWLSLGGTWAEGKEMTYQLRKMHQEFLFKNHAILPKMNIFYPTEIKNLCSTKDSIRRLKRQVAHWEKVFTHV